MYLSDEQWEEVLRFQGKPALDEEQLLSRYDLAIHMALSCFYGARLHFWPLLTIHEDLFQGYTWLPEGLIMTFDKSKIRGHSAGGNFSVIYILTCLQISTFGGVLELEISQLLGF